MSRRPARSTCSALSDSGAARGRYSGSKKLRSPLFLTCVRYSVFRDRTLLPAPPASRRGGAGFYFSPFSLSRGFLQPPSRPADRLHLPPLDPAAGQPHRRRSGASTRTRRFRQAFDRVFLQPQAPAPDSAGLASRRPPSPGASPAFRWNVRIPVNSSLPSHRAFSRGSSGPLAPRPDRPRRRSSTRPRPRPRPALPRSRVDSPSTRRVSGEARHEGGERPSLHPVLAKDARDRRPDRDAAPSRP